MVNHKLSDLVDSISEMNNRQDQSDTIAASLERVAFGQEATIKLLGITNDNRDMSVDAIRSALLPGLVRTFSLGKTLSLKINKRGAPPEGGGEVIFTAPVVKSTIGCIYSKKSTVCNLETVALQVVSGISVGPSQGPEMALRTRTCFPRASRLTISARRPASPTCQEPHFPNLASNSSGGLIPKPALELGSRGLSGPKSSNILLQFPQQLSFSR